MGKWSWLWEAELGNKMLWGVLYGKNPINTFLKELAPWLFHIPRSAYHRVMPWMNTFSINVKEIMGKRGGACEGYMGDGEAGAKAIWDHNST